MGGAGALSYNLPVSILLLLFLLPQGGVPSPWGEEGSWGSRILPSGVSLFPTRYGCSGRLLGLDCEGRPLLPTALPLTLPVLHSQQGAPGHPAPPPPPPCLQVDEGMVVCGGRMDTWDPLCFDLHLFH